LDTEGTWNPRVSYPFRRIYQFRDKGGAGTVMMTPPLASGGIVMSIRVQLRQVRFVTRQPYMELDGSSVRLRIPSIFGEVWNLNAADVVVVADQSTNRDDSGDDWVFEAPVNIPYAATTHPAFKPNLMLLFKTPQRIPFIAVLRRPDHWTVPARFPERGRHPHRRSRVESSGPTRRGGDTGRRWVGAS